MVQIKDTLSLRVGHDVNLGAVPDAGATPLAGSLPEDQRAQAAGATEDQRAAAISGGAFLNVVMDSLPLGLTRVLKPFERWLNTVAATGSVEAVQSAIQVALENVVAGAFYDPNAEIFDGVQEAAETGGTVGFVSQALSRVIAKARQQGRILQKQNLNALRSQAELNALDRVMKEAAKSPLKARDPSVFEQAVAAVTSDVQGMQTLYIDAREARNYFQSQGLDLDATEIKAILNLRAEHDADGGDLAIPLSTFAARFGEHYDALRPQVKLRTDGLRLEQLKQWGAELPAKVNAALDDVGAELEKSAYDPSWRSD